MRFHCRGVDKDLGRRPAGLRERVEQVHPDALGGLSIARQAKALKISRGAVYYKPRPVSDADLQIMRRVDQLHLEHPFMGARMLRDMLNREGLEIGRRHVATLMRRMGIEAIYRRPNATKATPGHKIYPYLPRKVKIEKPNHVWAMDISVPQQAA